MTYTYTHKEINVNVAYNETYNNMWFSEILIFSTKSAAPLVQHCWGVAHPGLRGVGLWEICLTGSQRGLRIWLLQQPWDWVQEECKWLQGKFYLLEIYGMSNMKNLKWMWAKSQYLYVFKVSNNKYVWIFHKFVGPNI